jgi:hypothetical protein
MAMNYLRFVQKLCESSDQNDPALGFVDEPSPKLCINFLPKQQEITLWK